MAARLREGMARVLRHHEIAGAVYGPSSTFHIYLGPTPRNGSVEGLSAAALKSIPPAAVQALQLALRLRGVDLMSYTGGVTSAAHTPADIDPKPSRRSTARWKSSPGRAKSSGYSTKPIPSNLLKLPQNPETPTFPGERLHRAGHRTWRSVR